MHLFLTVVWGAAMVSSVAAQSLLFPPQYTADSIVNAASQTVQRASPNTILTIYGQDLAFTPWAISPRELLNPSLPTAPPLEDVAVSIDNVRMPLFFVSPTQINVLVHPSRAPGLRTLVVSRGLVRGPAIRIQLTAETPELFRMPAGHAAATHADGAILDEARPAEPGEVIVLYGTGFGPLRQQDLSVIVPVRPIEVSRAAAFRVRLNGEELPRENILYVGVTPGFAGLYQLNLRLPAELPANPNIQVGLDGNWSVENLPLPTISATPAP